MKFLHESRMIKDDALDYKDKAVMSKYSKERRDGIKNKEIEDNKNPFVTKANFELVMGWRSESLPWSCPNAAQKYVAKYGSYQGRHEQKIRR